MSESPRSRSDRAFAAFLQHAWQQDIIPQTRGRQAQTRRVLARSAGRLAASAGLILDSLLHLRGRPFSRMLTILGGSAGAMLPDAWDWQWFARQSAQRREAVVECVKDSGEGMSREQALALLGLTADATADEIRAAWRDAARRWHPDHAGATERDMYRLRFIASRAAYEALQR